MRDLAGLVQCEVEAIGAVCSVGGKDGVEVIGLRGSEAMRGVRLIGVRLPVVLLRALCG